MHSVNKADACYLIHIYWPKLLYRSSYIHTISKLVALYAHNIQFPNGQRCNTYMYTLITPLAFENCNHDIGFHNYPKTNSLYWQILAIHEMPI